MYKTLNVTNRISSELPNIILNDELWRSAQKKTVAVQIKLCKRKWVRHTEIGLCHTETSFQLETPRITHNRKTQQLEDNVR